MEWKNLQFQINGWPPLASHGSMVLLGVFAATLHGNDEKDKHLLPLKTGWTIYQPEKSLKLPSKKGTAWLTRRLNGSHCLEKNLPLEIQSNSEGKWIAIAPEYRKLWQKISMEKKIEIATAEQKKELPPCPGKLIVRYRN